jgi:hypothetical protein
VGGKNMDIIYWEIGLYFFFGILLGLIIYRDAKYYVFKKNPLAWTIFVLFFPFGLIIYLIFRKSHIPKK